MEKKYKGPSIMEELWEYIKMIIFVVMVVFVINNLLLINARIPSESMENTIMTGDRIFGNRLAYLSHDPERFDIIVFPYQYEENTYYIKRIIGLPGETVQVVDGYVYINGSRLESDIYGNELMDDPMAASRPITLGEDEYFVLGDNRNHSQDSRDPSVGEVKKDTIMRKAWVRIYPFDKMGVIRHE